MLHVTSPEDVAFVLPDEDDTELAVEIVGGLYTPYNVTAKNNKKILKFF